MRQHDESLLPTIAGQKATPVFILGLHRSGTTWLYVTLARLLPVASLSVTDVVKYGELLTAHREGRMAELRKSVDDYFAAAGATTRTVDEVPLSSATLEEYGFVLRHFAGDVKITGKTAPLFGELCRKLAAIQSHEHVLMKNPWDTCLGPEIARLFPDAKFVYIRRDPIRILDSQVRMAECFVETENPLLALLHAGLFKERLTLKIVRIIRTIFGAKTVRRLLLKSAEDHIKRELAALPASIEGVPADRRIDLEYETLVADPPTALKPVVDFLGLPLREPLETVQPKPRKLALLPEVEARLPALTLALGGGRKVDVVPVAIPGEKR